MENSYQRQDKKGRALLKSSFDGMNENQVPAKTIPLPYYSSYVEIVRRNTEKENSPHNGGRKRETQILSKRDKNISIKSGTIDTRIRTRFISITMGNILQKNVCKYEQSQNYTPILGTDTNISTPTKNYTIPTSSENNNNNNNIIIITSVKTTTIIRNNHMYRTNLFSTSLNSIHNNNNNQQYIQQLRY